MDIPVEMRVTGCGFLGSRVFFESFTADYARLAPELACQHARRLGRLDAGGRRRLRSPASPLFPRRSLTAVALFRHNGRRKQGVEILEAFRHPAVRLLENLRFSAQLRFSRKRRKGSMAFQTPW
jgi:hypothetical protein